MRSERGQDPVVSALEEAEEAIDQVMRGQQAADLSPAERLHPPSPAPAGPALQPDLAQPGPGAPAAGAHSARRRARIGPWPQSWRSSRQPATPRGLFITLEGGEGSGKSSQAETLKALLEDRGYRVALTREPGGCELGRRLAGSPERRLHRPRPTRRALPVRGGPCPARGGGHPARPRVPRCRDLRPLQRLQRRLPGPRPWPGPEPRARGQPRRHPGPAARPHRPPERRGRAGPHAARRARRRPIASAASPPDFHERVRRGYLALATEEPERFVVVDGTLPAEEVTQRIWRRLEPLLPPQAA